MKFIVNFIVPLATLVLSNLFVIYTPNLIHTGTTFLIFTIVVFALSLPVYYYFFTIIFPSKDNLSLSLQDLVNISSDAIKNRVKTKADKFALISCSITMIIGYFAWEYLPKKIKEEELQKNGIETYGIITKAYRSRKYRAQIREYKFTDDKMITHIDEIESTDLKINDTVIVIYSSVDPTINTVYTKQ
jgi:hypothetical protein